MKIYIYGTHAHGKIITNSMRTTTDLVKVAEHYINKWKEKCTYDNLEYYITTRVEGPKVFVTELDVDESPIAYVGSNLFTLLSPIFQSNFADEIEKKNAKIQQEHQKLLEENIKFVIRESKRAKLLSKMSDEDKLLLGLK